MKRLKLTLILVCLLVSVAFAIDKVYLANKASTIINPGEMHTARETWVTIATTASAGDEPNDLDVSERTYATATAAAEGGDTKLATYSLNAQYGWNYVRFRCKGITNNQTVTHQIYLGTLGPSGTDCSLVKAGQLAWTIGQQVSTTATYEYADTLTVTEYSWPKTWASASPASDLVAEAAIDLMGADFIVVVPTTVNCNAILEAKGY